MNDPELLAALKGMREYFGREIACFDPDCIPCAHEIRITEMADKAIANAEKSRKRTNRRTWIKLAFWGLVAFGFVVVAAITLHNLSHPLHDPKPTPAVLMK